MRRWAIVVMTTTVLVAVGVATFRRWHTPFTEARSAMTTGRMARPLKYERVRQADVMGQQLAAAANAQAVTAGLNDVDRGALVRAASAMLNVYVGGDVTAFGESLRSNKLTIEPRYTGNDADRNWRTQTMAVAGAGVALDAVTFHRGAPVPSPGLT